MRRNEQRRSDTAREREQLLDMPVGVGKRAGGGREARRDRVGHEGSRVRNVDHERRIAALDLAERSFLLPMRDAARANDASTAIAADPVAKLRRHRDIPERDVGPLARARACRGRRSPSARAACRVTPASASAGVRRNSVHAMLSISGSDVDGEVPGLQSVAMAIGTPRARIAAIGGKLRLAQGVERAGQQHRNRPGTSHRRDPRVARVFEMVGRERAEFGGERGAAGIRELVGVQLHRQPVRARGRENASRLRLA